MSTVAKAISLLEVLGRGAPETALADLAGSVGFDKATTRRLLVSLIAQGLVEQDEGTRLYRLGAGLTRLALMREAQFPFLRMAVPVVEALAAETGETVHLSEFSAGALLTVHVELSAKANRVNVDVGQVLPLHGTASGIAFLAASRLEAVSAYLEKPLQAFTPHTMTRPDDLVKAIALAVSRGYSRGAQGYEEGVHSIGAAILGADGNPIGALAVASPVSRIDDTVAASQGEAASRAARLVSARLTGEA